MFSDDIYNKAKTNIQNCLNSVFVLLNSCVHIKPQFYSPYCPFNTVNIWFALIT